MQKMSSFSGLFHDFYSLKALITFTFLVSGDDVISLELIFACLYTRNDGNRLRFYHRSSEIIRLTQKIDHRL